MRPSETPEYHSWENMKARCYNPKHKGYARYGARGITVCVAWLDSFEIFRKDMGPKPELDHVLARKDKDLGYFKSNCQWMTPVKSSRARKEILKVCYEGEMMPLTEVSDLSGIHYQTLKNRIFRMEWPESDWFLPTHSRK